MDELRPVTKDDVPRYFDGDKAEIELPNDWRAVIRVERDEDIGEPWKEEDGHGPVSEWRRADDGKYPGERVLNTDDGYARYYDFAEAVRIARRDGWGCGIDEHKHTTKRARAACAVERDFERMCAWCRDERYWITIDVKVYDAVGEFVEGDSLGGVESDGDYWRERAAEMVNGIISGVLIPANTTHAAVHTEAV